jgi:hypothetical protein
MARRVFYSFHYKPDNWRASQVRNAGVVEGNRPVTDNEWESITSAGDAAIERWIDGQLSGKSCAIVLIGSATAGRKWINYEINTAWNGNKGVLGIYIHNLRNSEGKQSTKGSNPFDRITLGSVGKRLSSVVNAYDPPYTDSTKVYDYIISHLADWVDEAIDIRGRA